jgi:anti-sigma B factor antagonist
MPAQFDSRGGVSPRYPEGLVAANVIPKPHSELTIEHHVSGDGSPTLVCRGRMTSRTSDLFKSEIKKVAPGHKHVLADMSGVNYIDSSGLGVVVGAYMSAKSAGCELKLTNVHPHVRDLLNLTHLTKVLEG